MSLLDASTHDPLQGENLPEPLIPTPPPSASTVARKGELEDLFAPSFSPSTPRASPTTLPSAPLPEDAGFDQGSHLGLHMAERRKSSNSDEFGAFVIVSPSEDPLSASTSTFDDDEWVQEVDTRSIANSSISSKSKSNDVPGNPTLSYFDQFAQDAKERSAKTRSLLLDELLHHEDDPLYFLNSGEKVGTKSETKSQSSSVLDLHHDLDHEYFKPRSLRRTPSRSSSFPVAEPTLAPPVASPEGATRSLGQIPDPLSHQFASSPELINEPEEGRSQAQQALSSSISSLSESWMSTLIRKRPSQSYIPAKPVLESIFDHLTADQDQGGSSSHPPPVPSKDVLAPSPIPRRSSTSISPHRQRPLVQPTFTHTSAFAPPVSGPLAHGSSPFAPHVYTAPSGAPGFAGEGYDWDKGFSDELEADREQERKRLAEALIPGQSQQERGRGTNKDLREGHVKSNTIPSYETRSQHIDPASTARSSTTLSTSTSANSNSLSASKSGWGSGFGFWQSKPKSPAASISTPVTNLSATTTQNQHHYESNDSPLSLSLDQRLSTGQSAYSRPARDRAMNRTWHGSENVGVGNLSASEVPQTNSEGRFTLTANSAAASGLSQTGPGIGVLMDRKHGNLELAGRKAMTTPVLTQELASEIQAYLPALSRLPRTWTLIYSLDQHGISLNTLYDRCEAHAKRKAAPGEIMINRSAMLFVLKDAEDSVFGAWLAEGIRSGKGGQGYFGGGESFLWTNLDSTLKVYKCTGKNNYVAFCESDYISFGGGDGHYGLYIDETLYNGSSAPCPTFNNDPLCTPGPKKGSTISFECVGLEVWGMGP